MSKESEPSLSTNTHFALSLAVVTALVTGASYVPSSVYASLGVDAATAVAAVFLGATYVLVLRHDGPTVRAYGLSVAGVFEPEPLSTSRIFRAALRALVVAMVAFAVIVPTFWLGYVSYNDLDRPFSWRRALPGVEEVLGQIFVIALPEEAFFRGYVQTRFDAVFRRRISVLTLPIGASIVVTSALFALCHLLTIPNPARLAVFFPSLLFGALRAREGGIGAAVLLHAACNLLTAALARGYGG